MDTNLPIVVTIHRTYAEYAATNPIHVSLDNSEEAIVKYCNNNEGNKSLINEFISYSIASKIGVRIPKFGLCILNEVAQNNTNRPLDKENFGVAFYTKYIKKANPLFGESYSDFVNAENFVNVLILDHIIYNKDRHYGNYIQSPSHVLYAIDHTHVFKGQCIWNQYTFIQGMGNNDYLDKDILEYNFDTYQILFNKVQIERDSFNNVVDMVKTNLSKETINEIFKSVPEMWKIGIPDEDFKKLEEYVNYRIAHIDDIVEMICRERGLV